MKTIRCNLTKHVGCSQLSQNESLNKYMGILPKKFKQFHRFIEELYARLYHCYDRSIEFVSLLKLPSYKGL